VLVIPDGALHSLPFGALMPSGKAAGNARYLIEWRPIHIAVSTTVYDSIKKHRAAPTPSARSTIVAFGDPVYAAAGRPADASAGSAATDSARRGLALAPLPATRGEVQRIASRYPSATVYLGADATEERAKHLPSEARYVHFAVHGFVDHRFPLNSALALSQPATTAAGQDNGLLQVWEIFEQMRLGADLVTLIRLRDRARPGTWRRRPSRPDACLPLRRRPFRRRLALERRGRLRGGTDGGVSTAT
jgi:CHAT domain-containing protein